jgi:hypothetical protein
MAKRYMETRLYSSIRFVVHNKDTVKEDRDVVRLFFFGGVRPAGGRIPGKSAREPNHRAYDDERLSAVARNAACVRPLLHVTHMSLRYYYCTLLRPPESAPKLYNRPEKSIEYGVFSLRSRMVELFDKWPAVPKTKFHTVGK